MGPGRPGGPNYPNQVGKNNYGGAREYVTADFDGDGVDEIVNLNFDDTGHDLMAQSLGGRYQVSNTALTQVTVNTLI
ncbi:hypothetical protein [Streptomyces exfoliatus]|uniref:hypothetical protein n=1 Tax=Streptomyces exfoliatus TaxID=1905 RepID=UPI0004C4A371|nr:hypothetical protein [Streptomyces exfoliatus]